MLDHRKEGGGGLWWYRATLPYEFAQPQSGSHGDILSGRTEMEGRNAIPNDEFFPGFHPLQRLLPHNGREE